MAIAAAKAIVPGKLIVNIRTFIRLGTKDHARRLDAEQAAALAVNCKNGHLANMVFLFEAAHVFITGLPLVADTVAMKHARRGKQHMLPAR
jgi:hypothetical protein